MTLDKDIMIFSQVVFKGFVETTKRLPESEVDVEYLKEAILKTYKAGLLAQAQINKIK